MSAQIMSGVLSQAVSEFAEEEHTRRHVGSEAGRLGLDSGVKEGS